jgi:hypothetical protein
VLRDKLAVVIANAEMALSMGGGAGRERLERAIAAAWQASALVADPQWGGPDPAPSAEPRPALAHQDRRSDLGAAGTPSRLRRNRPRH